MNVNKNTLFKHEAYKWPLISSLLGCDYIKRIINVGFTTLFKKTLSKLVTWEAKETIKTINNNLKLKMTEYNKNELNKSVNLLLHTPALNN